MPVSWEEVRARKRQLDRERGRRPAIFRTRAKIRTWLYRLFRR